MSYGYPLTAVGGSGDYVWSDLTPLPLESSDLKGPFLDQHSDTADDFITSSSHIASVNQRGEVISLGLGESIIVSSDRHNPATCGWIKLETVRPARLHFLLERDEVLIAPTAAHLEEALSKTDQFIKPMERNFPKMDQVPDEDSIPELQIPMNFTEASENLIVLTIGLVLLDTSGRSLTDCRSLNITIRPLDPSIVKVIPGKCCS
ncbi:unnamed protein product [Protopolystoma xenopodis]|uniref:Uncharacterized protein n=1 Tax=Protopolystoma xenopodis TaxID=117903 RepID=A0A448X3Y4_9PLAT|nr:unnamed protein product [Protopolystoma xenopodis]